VVAAVSAFCGAPASLDVLAEPVPVPTGAWTEPGPGILGRWLLAPGGQAWGLLAVAGPLEPRCRAGLDQAARLLEAMSSRAEAQRERRGGSRGPAGSSFVPGLVHELRNAAFGFSAILDAFHARFGDREEALRYGGALRRNLEQFTGFIDELRAYGDPGLAAKAPLELPQVLGEAVATCQPRARELGRELSLDWQGPPARVLGDGAGLREAFVSLLRWALGQGGDGPVVLAAGPGAAGHLDGAEASSLDPARIFEPFYFRASGLGRLALPLARRILEAHGGTLCAGTAPGGALRLAFTLPPL
jgi:two-component system cell cycle sensor histidine kinase PleC